jgi:hypothetical protein
MREPGLLTEVEERKERMEYLGKKVELVRELRNISLEELAMVRQGGSTLNSRLVRFIDRWNIIAQKT